MKKLEFKINIAAPKQKVWETMLNQVTYKEWVAASWPGSYYEGIWKPEGNVKFLSPGHGGTLATLAEYRPYDYVLARHTGVLNADGTEDRDSDTAKGWIGITESYIFTEQNGITTLTVQINTNPEWEKMFSDGWPAALAKLKEICDRGN